MVNIAGYVSLCQTHVPWISSVCLWDVPDLHCFCSRGTPQEDSKVQSSLHGNNHAVLQFSIAVLFISRFFPPNQTFQKSIKYKNPSSLQPPMSCMSLTALYFIVR